MWKLSAVDDLWKSVAAAHNGSNSRAEHGPGHPSGPARTCWATNFTRKVRFGRGLKVDGPERAEPVKLSPSVALFYYGVV